MTEEVSLDVIKKTQESLGKFIKKPPLTEKLLKKPPFRFLHDILTNIINDTGFLRGLYNDVEMQSENIKDRDAKIAFLDKLINALKIVTGAKISARPSKIIAGLEPIKTNQLLQLIGSAVEKKIDSTEAVSQLTGVKISPEKPKKLTRQKTEDKEKTKKDEKKLIRGQTQDRITVKKKASPKTEKENRKNSGSLNNEPIKKTSKTRQESKETESPKETTDKNRDDETNEETDKKEKKRKEKTETVTKPEGDEDDQKPIDRADIKIYNEKKERRSARREKHNDEEVKQVEINISPHYPEEKQSDSIEIINKETSKKNDEKTEEKPKKIDEKPEVIKTETITKLTELSTKPTEMSTKTIETTSTKPTEMKPELKSHEFEITKKDIKRPSSMLRPPSVRPSSARPGAPRLKDRNDTILPPDQVVPLGKVKVIVESTDKNDQDEEETVVMETPMETSNTSWPATEIVREDLPAQKGHLVSQILEQIGEIPITTIPKPKIEWEQKFTDAGSEKLRQSIQTLTKAANPLGKLVNFLHEDVESMQAELKMWIDVNEKLKTEIKVRKRQNEESMKPLQEQLARLEADIAKQNELISTTQANILRNQQKIKSLLTRD